MNASDKIKQQLLNGDQAMHLSWLNKFAEGKLTEVEKSAFEIFVNECDDFILKAAFEGLKQNPNIEQDLLNIRQKIKGTAKTQINYNYLLKIAAILILVFSFSIGYYFVKDNFFEDVLLVDNPAPIKTEEVFDESIYQEIDSITQENAPEEITGKTEKREDYKFIDVISTEKPEPKKDYDIVEQLAKSGSIDEKIIEDKEQAVSLSPTQTDEINDVYYEGVAISESRKEAENNQKRSQNKANMPASSGVVNFQKARYPGGEDEMKKFIKNERKACFNTSNKTVISENEKVKLKLVITANGFIKNMLVLQSLSEECDKEAFRIVKKMPKWIPANRNGKNVEDEVEIELNFE